MGEFCLWDSEDQIGSSIACQTNAQFTFDIAPGTALPNKPLFDTLDTAILDKPVLDTQTKQQDQQLSQDDLDLLLKFLDQSQRQLQPQPVPRPLLPKPSSAANDPSTNDPSALKMLMDYNSLLASSTQPPKKRALETDEKLSAEEEKRRRNTAASARFRARKKLREQAMERTVKEMTEKSQRLESRVEALEREIKWLRKLLIEKNKPSE